MVQHGISEKEAHWKIVGCQWRRNSADHWISLLDVDSSIKCWVDVWEQRGNDWVAENVF